MTFWKALRWIASIAFVALVLTMWLNGGKSNQPGNGATPLPPVPTIQ
jgi:hypothetical protein